MKISDHCYALTGLSFIYPYTVNAGFTIGNHKTCIIDTGANYLSAQTIHGYAYNMQPGNDLLVMNTEPHFDHVGGNSFFTDQGIDILGHPDIHRTNAELDGCKQEFKSVIPDKARKMANEGDQFYINTRAANPNVHITGNEKLDLGHVTAHILATPGHTTKNLSCFIEPDKVLFCGDCIVTGYLPNLEEGGRSEWQTWLESLDLIEQWQPRVIVPGHGNVIYQNSIATELERMRSFLNTAIAENKAPTHID